MKLDSNTILITGGATGIGLALAERFLQADSIMQQIAEGRLEATFGFSAQSSRLSRDEIDAQFQRMNARR